MTDLEEAEKVDKAIGILKDAGYENLVIVGFNSAKSMKVKEFSDVCTFDKISQAQGMLQQVQTNLSFAVIQDSYEEESEDGGDDTQNSEDGDSSSTVKGDSQSLANGGEPPKSLDGGAPE